MKKKSGFLSEKFQFLLRIIGGEIFYVFGKACFRNGFADRSAGAAPEVV